MKINVLDDKKAECTVKKSAFVLRRPDVGSTSCNFLAGVMGGIASEIFHGECKAKETACQTAGSEVCAFFITKVQS